MSMTDRSFRGLHHRKHLGTWPSEARRAGQCGRESDQPSAPPSVHTEKCAGRGQGVCLPEERNLPYPEPCARPLFQSLLGIAGENRIVRPEERERAS